MNTKHTLSELYAKDGQIVAQETGKTIALIPYFDKDNENHLMAQNLLAAAPDLLQTLKYIVNEIETTPDQLSDALLGLIKIKARQAMNKATNQ
jgi:hypothetical protein